MPLSATPGSPFMWSFDRVVAGSAYAPATVQPVLHRYNDAKYVWVDTAAREWLRGFVRAHGGVPAAEAPAVAPSVDLEAVAPSVDLEAVAPTAECGLGSACAPIVLA